MRPAHKALLALTAGVVAYNFAAEDGETISEGVDDLLASHPLLTRAVILSVAAHVANQLPAGADPLGLGFYALRALRRHRPRVVVVVESEPRQA